MVGRIDADDLSVVVVGTDQGESGGVADQRGQGEGGGMAGQRGPSVFSEWRLVGKGQGESVGVAA